MCSGLNYEYVKHVSFCLQIYLGPVLQDESVELKGISNWICNSHCQATRFCASLIIKGCLETVKKKDNDNMKMISTVTS